jgi:hypothetical protein
VSSQPLALDHDGEKAISYTYEEDLEYDILGTEDFAAEMKRKAREYQDILSPYKKYNWVISSRDKAQALIADLEKYIEVLQQLTRAKFVGKLVHTYI